MTYAIGVWKLLGIRGSIALFFGIALAFAMFRAGQISNERDDLKTWQTGIVETTRLASGRPKLAPDAVALQITYLGNGVTVLKQQIAKTNAQALQRAADFDKSKKQAAQEIIALDRAAKVSDKRIERLQSMAKHSAPSCEAPSELLQSLEGL